LIELGPNRYGKSGIRLVKVVRGAAGDQVRDLTISISLAGDFAAAHLAGDNSAVVATDTMKNATYALAREHLVGPIEHFGRVLAQHFAAFPQVAEATVSISEHAWTPIPTNSGPAGDAFVRTNELTRTAVVRATAAGCTIEAGFQDLTLMKTARSGFSGFPRDEFTTLSEVVDRLMASRVSATWRYGPTDVDFDAAFDGVCTTLLDVFAEHHSPSVQATIWTLGQAILRARPEIDEIRLFLAPLVLGGKKARDPLEGEGVDAIADASGASSIAAASTLALTSSSRSSTTSTSPSSSMSSRMFCSASSVFSP